MFSYSKNKVIVVLIFIGRLVYFDLFIVDVK
ncbi:Uncharacterised protein [Salmonella enterica subsp. diarizonae]|nr:Uncharacterised protein [Salmonella enterica subsp. diarizonae]